MSENLTRTIELVFGAEGGYSNHTKDPGGPTKFGITAATLGNWRRLDRKARPAEVSALTLAEARQILDRQYAVPIRYAELPAGLDYALFDYAVNSGPAQAARAIQRIAGVAVDGIVGINTLAAIRAEETSHLINRLCDARLAFLRDLSTWSTFGKGWSNRVASVRATALQLAVHRTLEPLRAEGTEMARPSDTRLASRPEGKGAIAAAIGLVGTAIGTGKEAMLPLLGHGNLVDSLFAVLAASGVFVSLVGICLVAYGQVRQIGAENPT